MNYKFMMQAGGSIFASECFDTEFFNLNGEQAIIGQINSKGELLWSKPAYIDEDGNLRSRQCIDNKAMKWV